MMLFGFAGIAAIAGLIFAAVVLVALALSLERCAVNLMFLLGIAGAALLVILLAAVILHR